MFKRILSVVVLALVLLAAVLTFQIRETKQLNGVVRDAATSAPIAGAIVKIGAARATTDAQGDYSIAVSRGKSTLDVSADGYLPQQTTVDGDGLFAHSFTLDLSLTPNRVTGVVRDAETNAPLPHAQILIGDQSIAANAQGVFETRGVKEGTSISAQAPGYQPFAIVFDGSSDFAVNLTPNTVTVTAIDQYTNQPISDARIQSSDTITFTDARGQVVLQRVNPGVIRASAQGYENGSAPFVGGEAQIALRPNILDGVVTDAATGQPISGTLVYSGTVIVSTNAQGAYHLDHVPAKTTLVFKAPGYRKTQIDVSRATRRDVKLASFLVKGIHIPFGIPVIACAN